MTKPPGHPEDIPGNPRQNPDQFTFEVAQEIGVDLGKIDPQQVAEKERRLHRKGKRRG